MTNVLAQGSRRPAGGGVAGRKPRGSRHGLVAGTAGLSLGFGVFWVFLGVDLNIKLGQIRSRPNLLVETSNLA